MYTFFNKTFTVDVSENVTLPSALYLKPRYLFKL